MGNGRLEGMVALVTGAGGGESGGIGSGIARCLAQEGARVVVNDRTAESAGATVEQLRAMGAESWPLVGDVSDPDQAKSLVSGTVERFGQLDILVNNAGYGVGGLADRLPVEDWLRVISVNLNGPFFTSRAAVPLMRKQGYGRIINISSVAGIRVSLNVDIAYTSSKSALLGLTRHLAAEVAQYGITVNAILPGATLTPGLKRHMTPEAIVEFSKKIPPLRLAYPDDMGRLAAFLASREAGYITGTAIPVDGAASCLPGDFSGWRRPE